MSEPNKTVHRDFEPYIPVKDELVPSGMVCLYLYVSQEQLWFIMKDKALKLSRTQKTNDITENLAANDFHISDKVKEHGYICLSESINSPMMWGQYADRSKGACLVFGVLIRPATSYRCRLPMRGEYRVFFTLEETGGDFDIYEEPIYLNRVKYTNTRGEAKNVYELMSMKSTDWEHERECRIIVPLSSINDKHCIEDTSDGFAYKYLYNRLMPGLKRVILGPTNQASDIDIERKLNKTFQRDEKNKIRVFRADISPTDFSIVVPHQKSVDSQQG